MKSKLTSILALFVLGSFAVANAQGYDDDDIYFNPSKAKKETKKQTTPTYNGYSYSSTSSATVDFPAADTYTPSASSGIAMDVDAYNRRGIFAPADTVAAATSSDEAFACTQQIERFYNPRVVIESTDDDLARVYYAQPETTTDINIYVNSLPGYWGPTYYSPRSWFYYNSWAYNPWSWSAWGPSWSWSWGPSWSWGWGGYYPGYYPAYYPGYYPGGWGCHPGHYPSRPHYANRPTGNSRPGYRPSYRPGQSAARPHAGSYGNYGNTRPGYRPSAGSIGGTSRPSSSSPSYRPGQSSGSSSGYRSGSSNRSSSSPSYNRSGSSNRSSSSSSYRGGSGSSRGSSGGGFGGGGSRGGGGGGRGGRH